MSDEKKKSFWHTLPGILTGIAAIIVAITGLIGGLYTAGFFTPTSEPTTTPTPTALSAPILIAPANDTIFNKALLPLTEESPPLDSDIITFKWHSVDEAEYYVIEIDFFNDEQKWWYSTRPGQPYPHHTSGPVYAIEYEHEYGGCYPGRWRVCAYSAKSGEESWSDWCYFSFICMKVFE